MIQAFARPQLMPGVRFDIEGTDRIPTEGPAILVGNHRSYFDALAIGYTVSQVGRPLRFLGKKEVFDVPVVGQLASALGGIRVDRGTGSDEPLQAAAEALDGRRARDAHAAGHDPARPGVLRARAEGSMGRGAARGHDEGAGHPDRVVGHRAGVAPQRSRSRTC